METIITQNETGKWVRIFKDCSQYYASCRTGTGKCGGYNVNAVIEMATDYSTKSNLLRAIRIADEREIGF